MIAQRVNDKKRLETLYLEKARPASDLFPAGRLEPHEGPRLHSVCRPWKIGIEVTETVPSEAPSRSQPSRPSPRQGQGTLRPQAKSADVSAAFGRAENIHFNVITKSLAEFLCQPCCQGNRLQAKSAGGICHIGGIIKLSIVLWLACLLALLCSTFVR
jgi:hypothetical protein